MDWSKKTSDWQVCCLGQIAAGQVAAGGWYLFCFYSKTAGGAGYYVFSGIGLGVGGNASGVVNPEDYGAVSAPWTTLSSVPWVCGVNDFSGNDLAGATGRISSLGAGIYVVGYSITYISASPLSATDYYFYSQNVGGLGYGASGGIGGVNGQVIIGGWSFLKEASLRPS